MPTAEKDVYDVGSMVVANIDNADDGIGEFQKRAQTLDPLNARAPPLNADKIVTGSLGGILRVYKPFDVASSQGPRDGGGKRADEDGKGEDDRLSAGLAALARGARGDPSSALVLEESFNAPILQLGSGRFLAAVPGLTLAILLPARLVLASVTPGRGSGLQLARGAEYVFGKGFTACNMTSGRHEAGSAPAGGPTFSDGGAPPVELVVVQSQDGRVLVLEGARPVLYVALPSSVLPGPLLYAAKHDALLTLNSEHCLQAWAYADLAAVRGATAVGVTGGDDSPAPAAPPPSWSINLGEAANFLLLSGGGKVVDVPGFRTLFAVELGAGHRLSLQKRLDFTPVAACTLPGGEGASMLLAAHSGVLHVYRGTTLAWAARLPFTPTAMAVGAYGDTKGMLTLLSPAGEVAVVALGTHPPAPNSALTGAAKEGAAPPDYAAMEAEHRALAAVIREVAGEAGKGAGRVTLIVAPTLPPPQLAGAVVTCGISLPSTAPSTAAAQLRAAGTFACPLTSSDAWDGEGEGEGGWPVTTLTLALSHTAALPLHNVALALAVPPWASVPRSLLSFTVPYVPGTAAGGATTVSIPIRARGRGVPTAEPLRVVLSFHPHKGEDGVPGPLRLLPLLLPLPFALGARITPPVKSAAVKLTLDLNRTALPSLADLFGDMEGLERAAPLASSVLSFAFPGGGDATVLASKSGARLRLQASSPSTLPPLLAALLERLEEHCSRDGEAQLRVSLIDPLPLAHVNAAIDAHLAARHTLTRAEAGLNDRSHEVRLVIKRLLVRFKDRSPAPLGGMDALLEAAVEMVGEAASEVAQAQEGVAATAGTLSSAVGLLHALLPCAHPQLAATPAALATLAAHFPPVFAECGEQGWEERTEAALAALLKGGNADGAAGPLTIPEDAGRLKRSLAVLLDRVSEGSIST
jgi:Bardet-Biedl syndrome 9 protein